MTNRKRTARDIAAAVKLGAIDPDAPVLTADDAAAIAADAARAVDAAHADAEAAKRAAAAAPVNTGEHGCGIPGCRHGATTGAGHVTQPDRQVKLDCPKCGAVARMTQRAIHRAGGLPTCADGTAMVVGTRRTYTRRTV